MQNTIEYIICSKAIIVEATLKISIQGIIIGGTHQLLLVRTPRCLHFGVGSRADGLPQSVVKLLWVSEVLLEGVHGSREGRVGRHLTGETRAQAAFA